MKKSIFQVITISFCISLIFTGCATSDSSTYSNATLAHLKEKNVYISDSVFKTKKTVLLETVSQSLIRSIDRIISDKGKLYILDRTLYKVFVFNDKGKFVTSIGDIGKGPGEYVQLRDICFDASSQQLIFLCATPYKMIFFDLNGKFVKEQPLNNLFMEIKADRDYIYLLRSSSDGRKSNEYAIYTLNKSTQKLEEKLSALEEINELHAGGNEMTSGKSNLYSRRFDNQIYQLTDGEVTPIYKLDFGTRNFNKEDVKAGLSVYEFNKKCTQNKYVFAVVDPFETENYLTFSTNLSGTHFLSKKTNEIKECSIIHNSEYNIGSSRIIPVEGSTKVAQVFKPSFFIDKKSELSSDVRRNKKRSDIAARLTPDSNPVLVIYQLK